MALKPLHGPHRTESFDQVSDRIRTSVEQVVDECHLSRPVVGLYETVAASDAIPAQHHQVALNIVPGVFEDVMEREAIGLSA